MKKLLIVDDQKGIRMLLQEIFTKEGYKTYLASNGPEAFQLVENEEIDCVLLDMKLPGMDGKEILKKMKEDYPKLNVFIMTAFDEEELMEEAKSLGADECFTKPFNIFEVIEKVRRTMDESKHTHEDGTTVN